MRTVRTLGQALHWCAQQAVTLALIIPVVLTHDECDCCGPSDNETTCRARKD